MTIKDIRTSIDQLFAEGGNVATLEAVAEHAGNYANVLRAELDEVEEEDDDWDDDDDDFDDEDDDWEDEEFDDDEDDDFDDEDDDWEDEDEED